MITKDALKERIEALKRDHQVLINRRLAVEGAIMDCEFWLRQIEQAENNTDETAQDAA